jgi:hypothetical protein
LQGIKSDDQGSFRRDQGIRFSSAIWHSLLVTNPIVPTDLERCREAEPGRRQTLKVAEADLKLGFVHVKAPQACPQIARRARWSFPNLLPEASATILSRRGRSAPTTLLS